MKLLEKSYHRNGVSGAGFHVALFEEPKCIGEMSCATGKMLAVVFDEPGHVAVFDKMLLDAGEIKFMLNSWCGDWFEPELRQLLEEEEN